MTTPGETPVREEVASSAGKLGAGHLAGRFLGLVREMVVAFFIGAGMAGDAWAVAIQIPGIIRVMVSEGAVGAAIVPIASAHKERGDLTALWRFFARAAGNMILATIVLVIGLFVALPFVLPLYAPGFAEDPEKLSLAVRLSRLVVPYTIALTVAALCMGGLFVFRKFGVPALNTPMFNLVMIAGTVVLCPLFGGTPVQSAYAAGIAVLLAGVAQAVTQWTAVRRLGGRLSLRPHPGDPEVRRAFVLMAPAVGGVAAAQARLVVDVFLASTLATGSIAALEFGRRLIELPLGTFAVALSTALIPVFSRMAARNAHDEIRASVQEAFRAMLYILLPATVLIFFLRRELVTIAYERGEFAASAAGDPTALALGCFAGLLIAQAFIRSAQPAFFATQDPRTPVITESISLVIKIGLSVALMGRFGIGGLALGTVGSMLANGLMLHLVLARRIGFALDRVLLLSIVRTAGSAVAMGGFIYLVRDVSVGTTTLAAVLRFLVVSLGAGLTYILASIALRSEERHFVYELLHLKRRTVTD